MLITQAKDSEGQVSTLPGSNSSDPKAEPLYYGAMVPDAAALEKALGNSTLPVLHFFTEHEGDTETVKGRWCWAARWLGSKTTWSVGIMQKYSAGSLAAMA